MKAQDVPTGWISVGRGNYVLVVDVVAVYDGCLDDEQEGMAILPGLAVDVKAILLLRGGQTLPAFHSAEWVMDQIRMAGEVPGG